MDRSALDMQRQGTRELRAALRLVAPSWMQSPVDETNDGDQFTVVIDGHNYTVTVAFDDPR